MNKTIDKKIKKWMYERDIREHRRYLKRQVKDFEITQERAVDDMYTYKVWKKKKYFGDSDTIV